MRIHLYALTAFAAIPLLVSNISCDGNETPRDIWNSILKQCSASDLLGTKVMYFGPSNTIGPGAVWRKTQNGGYNLRFSLGGVQPTPANVQTFTVSGTNATCTGTASSKSHFDFAANFSNPTSGVEAGLQQSFSKATDASMKVNAWEWETLAELPYETYFKGARAAGSTFGNDLYAGNRYVTTRALKVGGLVIDLKFSTSDTGSIKASLGQTIKIGDISFGGHWSGENNSTLSLVSTDNFYIAGELSEWRSTGPAASGPTLVPVGNIDLSAKVGNDTDGPR
jgi:hypothetical protein